MKALNIYVYRSPRLGDCTNGGISSKYEQLLVLCENGYIDIDEANPPANLVKLVRRFIRGREVFHLEPVNAPDGAGWMAGGNYAGSCDSRFSEMTGIYGAIAIHDRQEDWKAYEMMSR